ncbi:heme-containing dehydratase protein [Ilyonectria robusta]|uniref:heme-containing dehydratase protein n=1 Tax=Ilyonectria robusta TaxID=1079257 RepID=UPI001E8D9EB5|nr:heme-containing dehydratase protein [Ilyonectria robusta]KAH8673251.1 heme-containing dehydratase protein [Ilyonectria robusta]
MWGVDIEEDTSIVYAIFGIQYPGVELVEPQLSLTETFNKLIDNHPPYIDRLTQDAPKGHSTRIWLAYWPSVDAYNIWWTSPQITEFWGSLAADAGMWREILAVPGRRTQFGTNNTTINGLSSVAKLVPYSDKTGYWGCYRDRLKEATPQERLKTPLEEFPAQKSDLGDGIRLGRTKITGFPDNLCFVLEGQDHTRITDNEKAHWFENFDGLVTNWIGDLTKTGASTGILDTRVCYSESSGVYRSAEPAALNFNRKIQLFYFLDLRYMEKIGRVNKGHVKLRESFMQSYCPAGPMGSGLLTLWVETSVLKGNEMQAEYVGCVEGTGFMAYEGSGAFDCVNDV